MATYSQADIIGTPFYVMEFINGRIEEDIAMTNCASPSSPHLSFPGTRVCLYHDVVSLLELG